MLANEPVRYEDDPSKILTPRPTKHNKSEYYVDNVELFNEIVKCRKTGLVNERLGAFILKLAKGVSMAWNFRSYTMRDDMEGEAIVVLAKNILKFNPTKSNNPHGYASQICFRTMINVINDTKKKHWGVSKALLDSYAAAYPELNLDEYAANYGYSKKEEEGDPKEKPKRGGKEISIPDASFKPAFKKRYIEGMSIAAIAKELKMGHTTMQKVLTGTDRPHLLRQWKNGEGAGIDLEAAIARRKGEGIEKRKRPTYDDHEIIPIFDLWFEQCKRVKEITKETGLSSSFITNVINGVQRPHLRKDWLRDKPEGYLEDFAKRKGKRMGKNPDSLFEPMFDKVFVDGETMVSMSKESGISIGVVSAVLNGSKRPHLRKDWLASKPEGFRPLNVTKRSAYTHDDSTFAHMFDLHYKQGKSIRSIAKEAGLSYRLVFYVIKGKNRPHLLRAWRDKEGLD